MKHQTLLFCSVLLSAPFTSAFANDAEAPEPQPVVETNLRQEVEAELKQAFNLDKITKNIVESSKQKLISADLLTSNTVLLEKQTEPTLAQLKKTAKVGAPQSDIESESNRESVATAPIGMQLAKPIPVN